MTGYRQKAMRMMARARPVSGFRPQTEAEWQRLQAASIGLGYAAYRDQGMDKRNARFLADMIHGGEAGRKLLELAFPEDGHENLPTIVPQVPPSDCLSAILGDGDDK